MRRSFILIGVALLCVATGALWWLMPRPPTTPWPTVSEATSTITALKPAREAPIGYIEYRNERYRFALLYPNSLSVKAYDEGGGAMTVTFQNIKAAEGFQIFIVPYAQNQISEARFRQDEPSGIRQKPLNVSIDAVAATSFYSSNVSLGDTAEIWFLHGGYLFEVTTVKPLAPWLSAIMQNWQFL